MKFVITYRRPSPFLETPPRSVIAREILFRSVWIREITDGHNRARNLLNQFRRRFRSSETQTVGDVPAPTRTAGLSSADGESLEVALSKELPVRTRAMRNRPIASAILMENLMAKPRYQ